MTLVLGLVLGYIIGAYLMRRHMLRQIKQISDVEVAAAMQRYEANLVRQLSDRTERTEI